MRKFPRRTFLQLTAVAAGFANSGIALADVYPSRPVRLIVGFPAGSAADIVARVVAQALSERLGQQVVVENRPGASTNIATEAVVRASPDGYTLLMTTVPNAINTTLYSNLNFNFLSDIVPVAGLDRSFFVMVTNPAFPAKTISEFIAYANANPGKVDMASNGVGTVTHIAGALFMAMSGVKLVHVPYSGNFFTDLMGGKVNVAFSPVAPVIGGIRDGTLRALAVTSAKRAAMFPDVPAMAEVIPGYEAILWDGFGAPKNTPAEIVDKLDKEINAALADPKVKARLADFGASPMPMSASEFGTLVADQTRKWGKVITEAGIKAE